MFRNNGIQANTIENYFEQCKLSGNTGLLMNPYCSWQQKRELKRSFDELCDFMKELAKLYYGVL